MDCVHVKLAAAVGLFSFVLFSCVADECTLCGSQGRSTVNSLSIEDMKQARIEIIKKQILDKLRLSETPDKSINKSRVPRELIEETSRAEQTHSKDGMGYYATTRRVIVSPDEMSTFEIPDSSVLSTRMEFRIDSVKEFPEGTPSAHLWIRRHPQNTTEFQHFLYYIEVKDGFEQPRHRIPHHGDITPSTEWLKYDVTAAINNQLRSDPLVIFRLDCDGCANGPIDTDNEQRPLLVIGEDSGTSRHANREKRYIDCSTNTSDCCRHYFYISFREIGWHDWILHPPGYDANFCRGHCSFDVSLSRNHHATALMEVMHSQRNGRINSNVTVQLCCSPSKMSSISLLYQVDNETVLSGVMPDMKVEECNCA